MQEVKPDATAGTGSSAAARCIVGLIPPRTGVAVSVLRADDFFTKGREHAWHTGRPFTRTAADRRHAQRADHVAVEVIIRPADRLPSRMVTQARTMAYAILTCGVRAVR